MADAFLRRLFVAILAVTFAVVLGIPLFPNVYISILKFVDVYILNDYVIGAGLVILAAHAVIAVVGGIYFGIRGARIWLARWRGEGHYKYKDPEKMGVPSRNPSKPRTFLHLRLWQWLVVIGLTTYLTLQVEPIEPFESLPLSVHLANAYMFGLVIYVAAVLLTMVVRSAIKTRRRA